MRYRVALPLLSLLLLAGCAGERVPAPAPPGSPSPGSLSPGSPSPGSGVRGRTVVDAGCPVPMDSSPCPVRPLAARISVTHAGSDAIVASVSSGADGAFAVALAPGGYTLRATNRAGALLPVARTVDVTVYPGGYTEVTIAFDSGIRGPVPPGA